MLAKQIQAAKKRFVAAKLNGIAALIEYLQTEEGRTRTLEDLNLELPIGINPSKVLIKELEYLSKCFSFFPQEDISAFNQNCHTSLAALTENVQHAVAQ